MSLATTTFTINNFPKGKLLYQNKIGLLGTVAISTGQYSANGIPISFQGHGVYEGLAPFDGRFYSPTTGIDYQFDPVNQSLRIFQNSVPPGALTTSAFSASTGWGGSSYPPTLVLSSASNQAAGSLSVETNASGSTGSNPTITYTFPTPYTQPPVVVISRGNDTALTAGYWAVQDANTTNLLCVFEFVGTPSAGDTYVLDWVIADVGTNPAGPVVAGSFAATGWGTSPTVALENSASTQTAFSLSITAGATPSTNPTVVLTFPVAFATAPVFICSDGVLRPTTGHWSFTGSTTTTASFIWISTSSVVQSDVYILDAIALSPVVSALTASAFALGSGFGSTATPTVTGNEAAFVLKIPSTGSGQGANPIVTLTIPAALVGVATYVVSRADTDTNVGYWAVEDASSTTTTLIVKFVGTPVVAHTYGLSAVAQLLTNGPVELAVGATIPPNVVGDTIYANVLSSYS